MDIDCSAETSNPKALPPVNAIGRLQSHLVTYSKELADTLYYIRRLPDSDDLQIAAMADKLRSDALSLHAMIDAIPDFALLSTDDAEKQIAVASSLYPAKVQERQRQLDVQEAQRAASIDRVMSVLRADDDP